MNDIVISASQCENKVNTCEIIEPLVKRSHDWKNICFECRWLWLKTICTYRHMMLNLQGEKSCPNTLTSLENMDLY
jgi:hypothetical protein